MVSFTNLIEHFSKLSYIFVDFEHLNLYFLSLKQSNFVQGSNHFSMFLAC